MKRLHVSYFLLSTLLIASCCLRGRDDQTFLVPETINKALPYTDNQEVVFISSAGDTLKTIVKATQEFYSVNCAECYCESKKYENKIFTLLKNGTTALVYIVADAGLEPGQVYVTLNNNFFLIPFSPDGKLVCDTTGMSNTVCFDSLKIQNQTYENVFQVDTPNVPDTTTFRIFYNADKGLLRMEQKDGHIWEVL